MVAESESPATEGVGTPSEVMSSQPKGQKRPIFGNEVPHRKRPGALSFRGSSVCIDISSASELAFLFLPPLINLLLLKHQHFRSF